MDQVAYSNGSPHIMELSTITDQTKSLSRPTYLDQVDLYFTANTVPDYKQVPILLSSIGACNDVSCVTYWHLLPNQRQRKKFSLHYGSTTNRHER